jgi:hypothetical protein
MIEQLSHSIAAKGLVEFSFSGTGFLAANDRSIIDAENNPTKPESAF